MPLQCEVQEKSQINRFCFQYLQAEQSLDFPDNAILREDAVQEELYSRLFDHSALDHPPPLRYQLRVLKELVARVESSIEDWDKHVSVPFCVASSPLSRPNSAGQGLSDNLMASLSELLSQPLPPEATAAQQKSYVTYHLSRMQQSVPLVVPSITLLESRALISALGTTGLRTWEAAIHLGQYLCAHPRLVNGQRVLELGAGTGFLSILCAKHLAAAHVIASDGSDDVVNNLPDNIFLNGLQDSGTISPMDLKWGHALTGTEEQEWNGGRNIDLVIGADITYDPSVIPALVGTLEELVASSSMANIVIAATERNRATFEAFQHACQNTGFTIHQVDFPVPKRRDQLGPFYNDQLPIHICRLRKATRSLT